MRKFISLFYKRIFIEHLDLSCNDELGDDFSMFIIKYFNSLKLNEIEDFQLETIPHNTGPVEVRHKSTIIKEHFDKQKNLRHFEELNKLNKVH